MSARTRRCVFLTILAFVLLSPLSFAATPREELLRLVPEDVGFCVVLQDLRGNIDRLAASPFLASFQKSPLGEAIRASDETQKLLELEKHLSKQLGLDWLKLRDEIFGDAVVFAYRPAPA